MRRTNQILADGFSKSRDLLEVRDVLLSEFEGTVVLYARTFLKVCDLQQGSCGWQNTSRIFLRQYRESLWRTARLYSYLGSCCHHTD
jgi:hypothetical protein